MFQTLGLTSLGPPVLLHRPWAFASMVPPPGMPLPTSRPRGRVPFERHPLCGTFVTILRAGRGEADRQSPTRGEAAWRNAGGREAGEEHPRPLSRPHPAGLPLWPNPSGSRRAKSLQPLRIQNGAKNRAGGGRGECRVTCLTVMNQRRVAPGSVQKRVCEAGRGHLSFPVYSLSSHCVPRGH